MSDSFANQKALLEALVVDNPELERLETLLSEFNIFEALGAVRAEMRHSNFLAFLLNPSQNHGLGDAFAKALLKTLLAEAADPSISPIDVDVWNLDEAIILREWQNVDILLVDERNHLVVLIENKIDSSEHSNQLQRYYSIVSQHHPHKTLVPLFLTPEGDTPSDDRYIPISYRQIAGVIENIVERRASTLNPDVRTLMMHYVQMLRRYIVKDTEIEELCQKIYRKHQRALDLIYQHRLDLQQEIHDLLELLIQEAEGLKLAHFTKMHVRFLPSEWDVPALKGGKGWVPEGHVLLFEFANAPTNLKLKLVAGPGRPEFSRRLFELARQKPAPLRTFYKKPKTKWNTIFLRSILSPEDYEDADMEEMGAKIRQSWKRFLETELPPILAILRQQTWIWEHPESEEQEKPQ
ncbi:hypothetical protein D6779_02720 [Candidatus Parcubacteria bacterium]|nr:MAG: hypothetical protein D6779_02720 [Candidatus Parcubacteria bacterium]